MTRRPTESNSGPSSERPEDVADRERDQVERRVSRPDAEEVREHERVGEEDRVVEKRLAAHQGQSEHAALRVVLDDVLRDRHEADVLALLDDRAVRLRARVVRLRLAAPRSSISADDLLGLVGAPCVSSQRGLSGMSGGWQRSPSARTAPRRSRPPADRLAEVRQHSYERNAAERGADPPAAVDREGDAAADAGRDQLVDRRVDRRVLAADPCAGEDAEEREAVVVPGEARCATVKTR